MKSESEGYHLDLLLLRLWREQMAEGEFEWRGEVKHTRSGAVRYFHDGASLYRALLVLLDDPHSTMDGDGDGTSCA